ncbi:unnamed protein product [Alopecurus aequalis]
MRNGAAFWNEHDTKVFCELCKEETDAGNTDDGYLSTEGYSNIKLKFNARTQRGYVREHFRYRWNSLKYDYARWLELKSSAGLGWDPEAGTFGADENWWTSHIRNNQWHARFRNGPPDNLSLLDEIFGKAHVGKSLAIPLEDLGEDKQMATRVDIDGSDEDAELTLCAMRKANLAKRNSSLVVDVLTIEDKSPLLLEYKKVDLGEDKEEATRVSIDNSGEDAELAPSAMKKAKLAECKVSSPMVDVLTEEDKNPLLLEYKKEGSGEDKEEATQVSIDGSDEDAELAPSAMKKARLADRKVSSPMVAASTTKEEDKNPVPQKYKKARTDLTVAAEASSCDSSTVPTIREAVALIRECGVSEATDLFYTATITVALNPECRELFALIRTKEGRLDWLQRVHDDAATRLHLSTSE